MFAAVTPCVPELGLSLRHSVLVAPPCSAPARPVIRVEKRDLVTSCQSRDRTVHLCQGQLNPNQYPGSFPQTLTQTLHSGVGWQHQRQGQTWGEPWGHKRGPWEMGDGQGTAGRNWKRRLQHKANAHVKSVSNRDMQGI